MLEEGAGYTLYGLPHSLYTGVARCYLRTQGIVHRERLTAHPAFGERIVPQIQRSIVPVLETPAAGIIQDSVDIIDRLEAGGVSYPAYPRSPLQRVVAILVQYYGSQAMLRHAMHYRWSYRAEQESFLRQAFASGAGDAMAQRIMERMHSYLPALGVTDETIPAIEASYRGLLDLLDEHFAAQPYLLGGRPTVADYGLIGPMFAHLGRDPVPANLMKTRAPRVYRWVERMTAPGLDTPEFPENEGALWEGDGIPPTLEPLLQHMVAEIFPELSDKLAFLDDRVARTRPADGEPVSDKPHRRNLGLVESSFRGVPNQVAVAPYILYVLRRADRTLADCEPDERRTIEAFLAERGLAGALPGRRGYTVDRRNHIEVWQLED